MSDLRYVVRGSDVRIEASNGESWPVVDALRAGRVMLVNDKEFVLGDGRKAVMYYVRLGPAPTGGHFIAFISKQDCEDLSRASNMLVLVLNDHPYDALPHAVQEPVPMSLEHFNKLPQIEHLGFRVLADGFWARRAHDYTSIYIRHHGEWIEREIWFEYGHAAAE